jgi:hypothetical protein
MTLEPGCPQNPARLAAVSPHLCCTSHPQAHDQRLYLSCYSPRPQQQAVAAQHIEAVAARVTGAHCQLAACGCCAAAAAGGGQVQVGVDLQGMTWCGSAGHKQVLRVSATQRTHLLRFTVQCLPC